MAEYEQQTEMFPTGADGEKTGDAPEPSEARKALVAQWLERIEDSEKFRKETFKAMRESQDFALFGAEKSWRESGKYTVPILPRYINQSVATLYARNPQTKFERRKRMNFKLWDGRLDTLKAAMELAAMGDAQSAALVQEVAQVQQQEILLDRMGQTLQILWEYYLDEQGSNYKQQLKAAVRRVKTCKVAWVKLGYQRQLEEKQDLTAKINDSTSKLARLKQLMEEAQEGELDEMKAEAEELRLGMADMQRDQFVVVREGPVLSFPKSDTIIVDKNCIHLKSLAGAGFVAEKFERDPEEIERIYGVDLGGQYTGYSAEGKPYDGKGKKRCCGYEVYDKQNQQSFVVVKGYPDFVREPASPQIWLERFWPYFPIVFNEVEHYEEIYPLSDLEQAKHIQNEYNRSREALRQHRIAARPWWVTSAPLDENEKAKIAGHADHEVITLPTVAMGEDVAKIIQRGPTAAIDPNLYEVEQHFQDLLRVVGYQEAQIGATSGATATESSIAQQSQTASQSDNVDDIDEVLSELARAAGQVMLLNVSKETVMEIVGDGAVWPDAPETREAAAKEILLKAEAGSTGRPNKAADLANMERAVPMVIQIPGSAGRSEPLLKRYLSLLDIDVEDVDAEGMPSITAMNALLAKGAANAGAQPTGDPRTDPASQGAQGSQNAPSSQANEPGPQPAYTPPAAA